MSLMRRTHHLDHSTDRHHSVARHEDTDEAIIGRSIDPNAPASPQAIQRLQQTHGNRFVQRLLQRNAGTEGDCPGGCV